MPSNDKGLESRTNGWMVAGIVLMLIGVLAFPIYRIYEPTARAEAAEETQNNLARAGAALWSASCASCHGAIGQGVDAPALNSIQFLTIVTDDQIASIVNSGIPGTEMVAYGQQFDGPLTRAQIASVVACIRSWEKDAPDRPDWRDMLDAPGGGHDEDGDAAGGHDEAPADHDEDGVDDHDEAATTEGPPPCGPDYDPGSFEDHDEDGVDDHDEAPADDHAEDGDADADGHDEETDDHADSSG